MANVQTIEKEEKEAVEIKQQENVRNALKQNPATEEPFKPVAETRDKVWFGGYALALLGLGVLFYLFTLNFFGFSDDSIVSFKRYTRAVFLLVAVLGVAKVSEVYLLGRI